MAIAKVNPVAFAILCIHVHDKGIQTSVAIQIRERHAASAEAIQLLAGFGKRHPERN